MCFTSVLHSVGKNNIYNGVMEWFVKIISNIKLCELDSGNFEPLILSKLSINMSFLARDAKC